MCSPPFLHLKVIEDQDHSTASLIETLEGSFDYHGDSEISLEDEAAQIHSRIAGRVGPRMPGNSKY